MAFVPSVLVLACSFTTGSGRRRSYVLLWSGIIPRAPVSPVLTEIRVLHGLGRRQPLLVVVTQQFVQQVQSFRTDQVLVLRLDELLPAFPCLPEQHATGQMSWHCRFDYRWTEVLVLTVPAGLWSVCPVLCDTCAGNQRARQCRGPLQFGPAGKHKGNTDDYY